MGAGVGYTRPRYVCRSANGDRCVIWPIEGFESGRPGLPPMGGMASTNACNCMTSWRLAPVRITASGMPCASVMRWCFEPGRAQSVGFAPVFDLRPRLGLKRSRR